MTVSLEWCVLWGVLNCGKGLQLPHSCSVPRVQSTNWRQRSDSRLQHHCFQAGLLQCTVEWRTGGDFWQTTAHPEQPGQTHLPEPGSHWFFTRYTGFRWGSGSYWLTRCGPQPLQRISVSWYRPMYHLGLCALPMLRCSSFLHTHQTGPSRFFCCCSIHLELSTCWHSTVQQHSQLSNATWKPIYSNSLSPPVLHQAPRYLRT